MCVFVLRVFVLIQMKVMTPKVFCMIDDMCVVLYCVFVLRVFVLYVFGIVSVRYSV